MNRIRLHGYVLCKIILMLAALGMMVGCSLVKPQLTPINREALRTPLPHAPASPPPSEGSLFAGESRNSLLFVDRKAHLVNDIITIRIIESTNASGEATTATDRDSAVQGGIDSFFGLNTTNMNLQASLENGFDGSGKTTRKNALTGTITAVVREVFPNGNLYIEGAKEVIINNERQYIIISGLARPEDISTDNSITSDRIADARIEYSGSGVLADKQRPGWLSRILDVVWPF